MIISFFLVLATNNVGCFQVETINPQQDGSCPENAEIVDLFCECESGYAPSYNEEYCWSLENVETIDTCFKLIGVDCATFEHSHLKSPTLTQNQAFGTSVARSGNTMVIGAPGEANYSGAVYVFINEDDQWIQQARLTASNGEENDNFGHAVAIEGDTLVVGAPKEDGEIAEIYSGEFEENNGEIDSGAAYVFQRSGGSWTQTTYLKSLIPDYNGEFGSAVALDNQTLAISAPNDPTESEYGRDCGSVFVFTNDNGWTLEDVLKASNEAPYTDFGFSLALEEDVLIVGSPGEKSGGVGINGNQDSGNTGSGAVYVFTRSQNTWSQETYIKASNADFGAAFGFSLAFDGNRLAVGAPKEGNDFSSSGAVYFFTYQNSSWREEAYIKVLDTNLYQLFGSAVALEDNMLAISAGGDSSRAMNIATQRSEDISADNGGAVYLFRYSENIWTQQAFIKTITTEEEDLFGQTISLESNLLIIGAPGEDSDEHSLTNNNFINSGTVFLRQIAPN